MNAYVAWSVDNSKMYNQKVLSNDVEGARIVTQRLERGDAIWRSWVELAGGSMISVGENGRAEVPADKLGDTPKVLEEYVSLVGATSVGVGMQLSDADKALRAAKIQSGNKIVFYTEEVDRQLEQDRIEKENEAKLGKAERKYFQRIRKAGESPNFIGGTYGDDKGIWGVPKLYAHVQKLGLKPQPVPLSELQHIFSGSHQADEEYGSPEFNQRADQTDTSFPIITSHGADGKRFIVDGFHRTHKLMTQGATHVSSYTIPSHQFPPADAATEEEYNNKFNKAETTEGEAKLRRDHYEAKRVGMADATKYQKKLLGEINDKAVHEVDGQSIRGKDDIDFCEGGNPSRYSYVPLGCLWVDEALQSLDKLATILHEAVEDSRMESEGMSYDEAHDIASDEEIKFREANKDLTNFDFQKVVEWFGKLHKAQTTMAPVAPAPQRKEQSEHSDGQNMYDLLNEERPAPPESTHAAKDMEERFHNLANDQETQDQKGSEVGQQKLKQVKSQVVQALQQIKGQVPVLEQIKQKAPETYQAVMLVVQAMIELAKEVADQKVAKHEDLDFVSLIKATKPKTKYPKKVDADWIYRWMSANHMGSRADLNKAPMEGNWELQDVDVGALPVYFKPTEPRVREYALLPAETAPPIILTEEGVLEGNHRVSAAVARGDKKIKAYVPVQKGELEPSSKPVPKETLDKAKLPMPHAPTRHDLELPVGSIVGHKVKVQHADSGTSWNSEEAGRIMGQDPAQHSVSSRNPGAR